MLSQTFSPYRDIYFTISTVRLWSRRSRCNSSHLSQITSFTQTSKYLIFNIKSHAQFLMRHTWLMRWRFTFFQNFSSFHLIDGILQRRIMMHTANTENDTSFDICVMHNFLDHLFSLNINEYLHHSFWV